MFKTKEARAYVKRALREALEYEEGLSARAMAEVRAFVRKLEAEDKRDKPRAGLHRTSAVSGYYGDS